MKIKTYAITAFLVLVILILVSLVTAFGISSPYKQDRPLEMMKGQTETVNINLQNMVGNEDITVRAEVVEGTGIASLTRTTYTVKAKTHDTFVPLKITVPKDASGTKTVKAEFKTVEEGEEGMVTLGTGYAVTFDVIISEKEIPTTSTGLIVLIIIIVLIILAYLVLKKRK